MAGHQDNGVHGDALVTRGKSCQQFGRSSEKARGRPQAPPVDAVARGAVVVLQVHVASGELDESFVKNVPFPVRTEPDVLEDIVGLVVGLRVEEPEILDVARMPRARVVPTGEASGNGLVFAHRVRGQQITGPADRTGENPVVLA